MPAFDQCHDQVVRAFENDGWTLVASNVAVPSPQRVVYIDAAFQRGRNGSIESLMLIEIKCFSHPNTVTTDLYTAIGQYLIYRSMLAARQPIVTPLYLVVPMPIFRSVFDTIVIDVIDQAGIQLVTVDLIEERIVSWYKSRP